jgi:hypothetical protein
MASCEFLASTSTTLSAATPTLYVFVKLFLPFWVASLTPRRPQEVLSGPPYDVRTGRR